MTRDFLRIRIEGCGVWGWGGGGEGYYYHYCLLNNCLFCFSFVIFTWLSVSQPASPTLGGIRGRSMHPHALATAGSC